MAPADAAAPWWLERRLRRQLLLSLLLLWLLGGVGSMWALHGEIREVLDSALEETAQRLLMLPDAALAATDDSAFVAAFGDHEEHVVYQVFDGDGVLRLRSHRAPLAPLASPRAAGLAEQGGFRVISMRRADGGRVVHVAETLAHRREVVWDSLPWLLLPLLAVLPLAAWVLHSVLRAGFRTLQPALEVLDGSAAPRPSPAMRRFARPAPALPGPGRQHRHRRQGGGAGAALRARSAGLTGRIADAPLCHPGSGRYFAAAPAADAAWAVYFLAGGKPRQAVPTALLRETACAAAGIDDWLFEECYQAVGDLAETIAHVLPPPQRPATAASRPSRPGTDACCRCAACRRPSRPLGCAEAWDELDAAGRFLLVKLIGGGFRVGVSKLLVQRALAEQAGLDAKVVAQRLMGWTDARATPSAAVGRRWSRPGRDAAFDAGASPTPFSWRTRCRPTRATRWARRRTGWWSGSTTASAPSSCGARGRLDLVARRGAGDRALPRGGRRRAALPDGTVLDGELLVWPGQTRRRRRSTCCSSASAARR
jgi:hypothetical protein